MDNQRSFIILNYKSHNHIFNLVFTNTAPVGPPTDFEISSTATSVSLQWLPPYDPKGEVVSYGVTYHLVDSSTNITTPRPSVILSGINDTQVTLEPLLQSSKYTAIVYAITSTGTGPESKELILMTTAPGKYVCIYWYM